MMLTLPNLLTLSRIFAVPILVFLLWRPAPVDYAITFVLYCIVGITDYFDGYLARAHGQISKLGQFLDPIADKIMVAAVIIMLMASRRADGDAPIIQDFNVIPALIILLREIIVSGLREFLAELKVSIPVSRLAKWKTTLPARFARRVDPWRCAAAPSRGASRRRDQPVAGGRANAGDGIRLSPNRPAAHGLTFTGMSATNRFSCEV